MRTVGVLGAPAFLQGPCGVESHDMAHAVSFSFDKNQEQALQFLLWSFELIVDQMVWLDVAAEAHRGH